MTRLIRDILHHYSVLLPRDMWAVLAEFREDISKSGGKSTSEAEHDIGDEDCRSARVIFVREKDLHKFDVESAWKDGWHISALPDHDAPTPKGTRRLTE